VSAEPAAHDLPGELVYTAELERWPAALRASFVQLARDPATDAYLARVTRARHGVLRTWFHHALRNLWSDYDLNGWLGMYPMHLLSKQQWRTLLGPEPVQRCLDVGAGDGEVTSELSSLCRAIEASETSSAMATRLEQRGIPCLRRDLAQATEALGPYDLISCLNVLDRCAYPLTLLRKLCAGLAPGGRLVVALALPYRPFYYVGASTPEPEERLPCPAVRWEDGVSELVQRVLLPLGLRLVALSRVPYLSCGDAHSPLYVLDDAIVVLQKPAPA
jgi:SAM-dependent methyltransferase